MLQSLMHERKHSTVAITYRQSGHSAESLSLIVHFSNSGGEQTEPDAVIRPNPMFDILSDIVEAFRGRLIPWLSTTLQLKLHFCWSIASAVRCPRVLV